MRFSLRPPELQRAIAFGCAAFGLACSLALGGSTHAGFLADVLLQLAAVPVLLVTAANWSDYDSSEDRRALRMAVLVCIGLVALPALQLVPLPPAVWQHLPGHFANTEAFHLLDRDLPWLPVSVTPRATRLAMLSLLPTIAVFLATVQQGYRRRRQLTLLLMAFAGGCAFLGLLQLAQGEQSPLRPFAFTNRQEAVGLFANRNHYAALLYCALLMTVAWAAAASAGILSRQGADKLDTNSLVAALGCLTLLVVFICGVVMSRSRAGLGLTVIALIAGLMMPLLLGWKNYRSTTRVLTVSIVVGAVLLSPFAIGRLLDRLTTDAIADVRLPYARNTIEAALAHMPLGSGIGSFVSLYGSYEKPLDAAATVPNRAHADFIEAWLETGAPGIALLCVFMIWFAFRLVAIVRRDDDGRSPLDRMIALGAAIAIAFLLLHSVVDYPLRTGAMAAVFAMCCAFLLRPPPNVIAKDADAAEASMRRTAKKVQPKRGSIAGAGSHRPFEGRRDEETRWPQAWRSASAVAEDPATPRASPTKKRGATT